MSYRCSHCNTIVNGQMLKVVTSWREKHYPWRPKAFPGMVLKRGQMKCSNKQADRADDPGGRGKEIAKEVGLCVKCAKPYQPVVEPEQQTAKLPKLDLG